MIPIIINLLIILAIIFRFWAIKITLKLLKSEIQEPDDIYIYEERNPISRKMIKKNPNIMILYNIIIYIIWIFFLNFGFIFYTVSPFWMLVLFWVTFIYFLLIFIDFLYDFISFQKDKHKIIR